VGFCEGDCCLTYIEGKSSLKFIVELWSKYLVYIHAPKLQGMVVKQQLPNGHAEGSKLIFYLL
jgi:hypothetical protein